MAALTANCIALNIQGNSVYSILKQLADMAFHNGSANVDWKASDGEDVNCWICLGVPQAGEDDQVKIIGTLCRKIIHQDFINQLKQGDVDQVLALLNQTLTS